jgi:hypothetical protein
LEATQHVPSGNSMGKFKVHNNHKVILVYNSDVSESSWSTEGIKTEVTENKEERIFDVICKVDHLTSFAILLDVNKALSVNYLLFLKVFYSLPSGDRESCSDIHLYHWMRTFYHFPGHFNFVLRFSHRVCVRSLFSFHPFTFCFLQLMDVTS